MTTCALDGLFRNMMSCTYSHKHTCGVIAGFNLQIVREACAKGGNVVR